MTRSRIGVVTAMMVWTFCLAVTPSAAQPLVPYVGMGDSLGEGVQSADASAATQPFSYLNLIAWRLGAPFPLPLIRTNLLGVVGDTVGRSRLNPSQQAFNLAVSGADIKSILFDTATATDPSQIDSETELVLFPSTGSQIDIAERLRPSLVACWIGNNDALQSVTDFDHLDASQLTPIPEFAAHFQQLVGRLSAIGARAVFGTIPNVTGIGFLLDRADLVRLLGSSHGLAEGSFTTVPAMFLVKLGLASPDIFTDPNYVLDPAEQRTIAAHISQMNDVIRSTVQAHDMALAETNTFFDILAANGLNLFGTTITTRFLGGVFSLDAVHPSNIGHALVAFFFIEAINQKYGAGIPQLDAASLYWLTLTDPFIDKDGDGRVRGRPGKGLLETVLLLLGISGDFNDGGLPLPTAPLAQSTAPPAAADTSEAQRTSALDEIARQTGRDLRKLTRAERVRAMHELFGVGRRN